MAWFAPVLAAIGSTLTGGLLDWAFGKDDPKMPKQAGQVVPDTKPPLQVPQAPPSQMVMPQMGGGAVAGGRPPANDILARALQQWMGR